MRKNRRCILHFGMHKTGSTSIQKTLFCLRNDLPWLYLNSGEPNSSVALKTMFSSRPELYDRNRKLGLTVTQVGRLKENYFKLMEGQLKNSEKDVLLSGEGMSTFDEPELKSMVDWLSRYVGEVIAVGYIRPPKSYMESAFQQSVRSGLSEFKMAYPEYRKRFEKFERILGEDNVIYWLYDRNQFPNGCVVNDFAQRLGFVLPRKSVRNVNEGLSLEAIKILYAYRKYGDGYGVGKAALRENLLLIKKLSGISGGKFFLSQNLVDPVIAVNKDDIAWIEKRLGCGLEEDCELCDYGIDVESDLWSFSDEALSTLTGWLPKADSIDCNTPENVALLVMRLRKQLKSKDRSLLSIFESALNRLGFVGH